MNIIGISAFYHDSSCCLIQDGIVKAAAEEERFTRVKHDSSLPINAFMYCLNESSLSITDIDYIAYYENPYLKLDRQIKSGYDIKNEKIRYRLDPKRPEFEIRERLGYDGEIKFVNHHLSHAASSYLFSGFDEAAILTVDGVGEWDTTTLGYGKYNSIDVIEKIAFPNSLGLLYATITHYLGFRANGDEYKVMGLAPYGNLIYVDQMHKLLTIKEDGRYNLSLDYFQHNNGEFMYSNKLFELLGQPARTPESEIKQFHKDIARSLQYVLEESMLSLCDLLKKITNSSNLCLAGGVALNCVSNGRILRNGKFKNIYIQPAANDAGCSLGAAAQIYTEMTGEGLAPLNHVYLGPEYTPEYIRRVLNSTTVKYENYENNVDGLVKSCAEFLANGKVLGWFQGNMEFGPRSLGCRSILADPRDPNMREKVNSMVKMREAFRPFAPAVALDNYAEHFDIDRESPYMLFTCKVISSINLPAITHVDGSARIQTVSHNANPIFYKLLKAFEEITGCPILLNTSFNIRGEPIVMSPEDAIKCFISTEIDILVLGPYIIKRDDSLHILNYFIKSQKETHTNEDNYESVLYTFI